MPQASSYLPPTDGRSREIRNKGQDERRSRIAKYSQAVGYYRGQHKKHLDVKPQEPDDNVVLNLVNITVTRTAAFLFPSIPKIELKPQETEQTPEEKWLEELIVYNGGLLFLQKLAMNGAFSGHVYTRVIPEDKTKGPYPRLIALDPRNIISYWRPDDMDHILWHEIYWSDSGEEHIIDFVFVDESRWQINEYVGRRGMWTPVKSVDWPYRLGPIVHWQHLPNPNEFYGRGDVENVDLQDSMNLILSEMARIVRYHASPRTVLTGAAADEVIPTSIDHMWSIEDSDAEVTNLEMKSELVASQQLAALFYDTYLSEQRVVVLRGEVKDFQRVTNTGVRTVFMDMLSKNDILREQYGRGLQNILFRTMILNQLADETDWDMIPTIVHGDPLPTDMTEVVNNAAIERSMEVVSKETISTKLGYNWADEEAKMKNEKEAQIESMKAMAEAMPQPAATPTGKKPVDNPKTEV